MRRGSMTCIAMVLAAIPVGVALAQTVPNDVRDLVGARAAAAEVALNARGYANVGSEVGDDRKWGYWWNARRSTCLSVTTMEGRIDSIMVTPKPDCERERASTLPGPTGPAVDTGRPTTLPGPTGPAVTNGRVEQLRFDRGVPIAVRRGQIKGYETMSYLVDLRAGQPLAVTMQASNSSAYFNVTAPGANEALFIGSTAGSRYLGRASSSGSYKIDIYLMRNAARRGETARYLLSVDTRR